jgi:hypothetical protein
MILSLLAVAWMNASLQPCLMAMEIEMPVDHQPMQSMQHAAPDHAQHDADHEPGTSCEHCPPAHVDDSCDSALMAECAALPDFKHSARYADLELDDAFHAVAAPCPDIRDTLEGDDKGFLPVRLSKFAPGVHPPLNLRNCVFLK